MVFSHASKRIALGLLFAVTSQAANFGHPDPYSDDPLEVLGIESTRPTAREILEAYKLASENIVFQEPQHQEAFARAKAALEKRLARRSARPVSEVLLERLAEAKTPTQVITIWGEMTASSEARANVELGEALWEKLQKTSVQLNNPAQQSVFVSAMAKHNVLLTPGQWRTLQRDFSPDISRRLSRLKSILPKEAESSVHARVLYFLAFADPKPPYRSEIGRLSPHRYERLFTANPQSPSVSSMDLSHRLGLPPWATAEQVDTRYQEMIQNPHLADHMGLREAWALLRSQSRQEYETGFFFHGAKPGLGPNHAQPSGVPARLQTLVGQATIQSLQTPEQIRQALSYYRLDETEDNTAYYLSREVQDRLSEMGSTLQDPRQMKALVMDYLRLGEPPTKSALRQLLHSHADAEAKIGLQWLESEYASHRLAESDLNWLRLFVLGRSVLTPESRAWHSIRSPDSVAALFVKKWMEKPNQLPVDFLESRVREAAETRSSLEKITLFPDVLTKKYSLISKLHPAVGLLGAATSVGLSLLNPDYFIAIIPTGMLSSTAAFIAVRRWVEKWEARHTRNQRHLVDANEATRSALESLASLNAERGVDHIPPLSPVGASNCEDLYRQLRKTRAQ